MKKGKTPQSSKSNKVQLELRGGNGQAYLSKDHEHIVEGPSQTGKTVAMCFKLHTVLLSTPKAHCLIVRKVYKAMRETVLQTFERLIVGCKVMVHGGENRQLYLYPNGSRLVVMGMDNPGNTLSGEFDVIYVNQAEELTITEWEMLARTVTGRGAVVKDPLLFGDCNPSARNHWILKRAEEGRLKLFHSRHYDNPVLFDDHGVMTEEGKKQLANLEKSLTGIRADRLFKGLWRTAEGCVYAEFDPLVHVCVRDEKEFGRWFMALDDGFTNPAVILLVGEDTDGRHHIFREFYQTGQAREVVVKQAREWDVEKHCETVSVDAAAPELIAQLIGVGLPAMPGKGDRKDGIRVVQDRIHVRKEDKTPSWPDGRPRLTVDPSCINTINEFQSYVYKPDTDEPKKENDHTMDAYRYLTIVLGEGTGVITNPKDITIGLPPVTSRQFIPRRYEPTRRL